jgi:hypothetical protein
VADALRSSWDDQGLLEDFTLVQESGVTKVANYRGPGARPSSAPEAAQFRKNLKVGSESHCGLVIEVKAPIAKVQAMGGEVWLQIAQLYPKGGRECRFVNGVHQESEQP